MCAGACVRTYSNSLCARLHMRSHVRVYITKCVCLCVCVYVYVCQCWNQMLKGTALSTIN